MPKLVRQILRDNSGASAVEYGLIISLIVLAMLTALSQVATKNTSMWTYVKDSIAASTP